MKIFNDKNLTEETTTIHLGRVRAGTVGKKILFFMNDKEKISYENIILSIDNTDVTVTPSTFNLDPGETKSVEISWNAPIDFNKALETSIKISADEVYLVG